MPADESLDKRQLQPCCPLIPLPCPCPQRCTKLAQPRVVTKGLLGCDKSQRPGWGCSAPELLGTIVLAMCVGFFCQNAQLPSPNVLQGWLGLEKDVVPAVSESKALCLLQKEKQRRDQKKKKKTFHTEKTYFSH